MRRRFWLASAVILLDEALYIALIPVLPYYAERFGLSKTEVGAAVAAYPLLMLASSVPAGLLTDRIGPRRLLVVGTALLVLSTIGFAYAQSEWALWVTRALQGLTSGFISVAGMALIAGGASAGRRGTVIGIAVSLTGLGTLVGPALGGYAAPALGVELAFLLPAAFGLLVLAGLLWPGWVDPVRPKAGPAKRRVGFRSRVTRALTSSVASIFAVGLVGGAVTTLAPLRLDAGGYSASDLGTLFLVGAVAGLIAAPLVGRLSDAHGVGRVAAVWALLVPLLVLGHAVSGAAITAAVFLVALLPVLRVGGSIAYALGAEHAPLGAGLAVGYGVALSAWSLGAVAGPLAAGALADHSSDAVALLVTAVAASLLVPPIAASRRLRPQECAVG
jgi:MFS family permease